jgi:hypothetical protein
MALTIAAVLRNGQLHLKKIFTTGQQPSSSRDLHVPLVMGTIGELRGNNQSAYFPGSGHGI